MASIKASPILPPIVEPFLEMAMHLIEKVGKDICMRGKTFPIGIQDGIYRFAIPFPGDELLRDALQLRLASPVEFVFVEPNFLEGQLIRLSETTVQNTPILSDLIQSEVSIQDGSSLEEIRKKSQSEPVIKLVENLMNQAINEFATDVHIEPGENQVKVRYRKDGMLKNSLDLPKWVQASLISRIKILADLDIAEKRLPQDGRIKWFHDHETIDMRVSTLPTRMGEKVVIRILRHLEYVSALESLGMDSDLLQSIKHIIHRPQGMLFVTGPTGSGKSSTLYASLKAILSKDINISTIEDPIEYRLDGANQVQIHDKAGLTFASALRSILRQDPDVIMVGEIRDEETAAIAVQAAQTGHLVFSTLHTNDSVSAITRLLDLRVKPFLISSAVLGVLSQRLVRILCPQCKSTTCPTEDEKLFLPNLPDSIPQAVGCTACNQTGFRGRIGIFEFLPFDAKVREGILTGLSEAEIKRVSGYKTMVEDGMEKMKNGITTASELIRVAVMETQG